MKTDGFCQSCSMPLNDSLLFGTERDGSKSSEYCKYCYQDGAFVNPAMTLKEMTSLVVDQMKKRNIDPNTIQKAVLVLPYLKRWTSDSVPL